jgi:hypothetical protein
MATGSWVVAADLGFWLAPLTASGWACSIGTDKMLTLTSAP